MIFSKLKHWKKIVIQWGDKCNWVVKSGGVIKASNICLYIQVYLLYLRVVKIDWMVMACNNIQVSSDKIPTSPIPCLVYLFIQACQACFSSCSLLIDSSHACYTYSTFIVYTFFTAPFNFQATKNIIKLILFILFFVFQNIPPYFLFRIKATNTTVITINPAKIPHTAAITTLLEIPSLSHCSLSTSVRMIKYPEERVSEEASIVLHSLLIESLVDGQD